MLLWISALSLLAVSACRDMRQDGDQRVEGGVTAALREEVVVNVLGVNGTKEDDGNAEAREKALEKLQEMFGLADTSTHRPHQVPPQFMTELYKTIADPSGMTRGKNPFGATVVRSFIERDNSQPHFFSFNISGLDPKEKVLEAELHLYRMRSLIPPASQSQPAYYLISVFQVVNESRLNTPDIHRLLGVHYVGAHEHGWQVFNVKAAVLAWVSGASPNLGLLVTTSTVSGERANVRFARRDAQHNSKQPILVLFDDDGKEQPIEATPKPNPLANYPNYYKYQSDDSINEIDLASAESVETRQKRSAPVNRTSPADSECSRHDLYVDFETIGWSSWIISPKGYSAYHCQGHCRFPLGQGQKPTNHATVQSIVNELQLNKDVGRPCCVPSNHLPISVLFFDDNFNVVLKKYEDMVAESCGCH